MAVTFHPGWPLTVFVGVFLPVFVALGSWQLNRAEQKAQLSARIDAGRQVELLPAGARPEDYQHYQLDGRLDSRHVWLLDNRTHKGQAGYEVWVPLNTDQGWYLVSAGWVAGGADRRRLPEIELPEVRRPWLAQARPLSESVVLERTPTQPGWPSVVQSLVPAAMAEQLGRSEPLGLLQLTEGQAGVGPVIWTPTVMSEARHRGYAVQWFAMAAALLLMYLYAGRRQPKPASKKEDIG